MSDFHRLPDDVHDEPAEEEAERGAAGLRNMLGPASGGFDAGLEDAAQPRRNRTPHRSSLILAGTVLVGGCVLGAMYWRAGGPAVAFAATDAQVEKSVQMFLNETVPGGADVIHGTAGLTADGAEQVVERLRAYPAATQVPLSDLATNPFRHGQAPTVAGDAASDVPVRPNATRREADRVAALEAVRRLALQTVMHSPTPGGRACMINNRLWREGQQIIGGPPSFTLEEIHSDGVVVRTGEFRFRLVMEDR